MDRRFRFLVDLKEFESGVARLVEADRLWRRHVSKRLRRRAFDFDTDQDGIQFDGANATRSVLLAAVLPKEE